MAQMTRLVEVVRADDARMSRSTLASRIADTAAAKLLLFDQLPEDERPRKGDRVLLVGIVWGGSTLVELEQVEPSKGLSVSRLFDLPASVLPKNFQLAENFATLSSKLSFALGLNALARPSLAIDTPRMRRPSET